MSVILIVADGCGFGHYSALFQDPQARRVFERFPHVKLIHTSPAESQRGAAGCIASRGFARVTESASSASAMSTGRWVRAQAVAVDHDGRPLPTLCERVRRVRPDVAQAVLCTTDCGDATPAAFLAHSPSRYHLNFLRRQVLDFGLDILIAGVPVVEQHATPRAGCFSSPRGHWEMALELQRTLRCLHPRPFFLLVEESLVDVRSHQQDIAATACELTSLARTVATALDFVATASHNTTLLVVSDHATGAATVRPSTDGQSSQLHFGSGEHDGHVVPLFIAGAQADLAAASLKSSMANMTDVNRLLRFLLHV